MCFVCLIFLPFFAPLTFFSDVLLSVVSLYLVEMLDESHGPATPEEISGLEEFIPTRLTCLTLLQVSVTVSMAEFNLLHTLLPVIMGHKVVHRDLFLEWSAHIIIRHLRRTWQKSINAMRTQYTKPNTNTDLEAFITLIVRRLCKYYIERIEMWMREWYGHRFVTLVISGM